MQYSTMLSFLHDNAMQVSGLLGGVLAIALAFTHFSTAQTAALIGGPVTVGNFLAGLVLSSPSARKAQAARTDAANGNGHLDQDKSPAA